MWLGASRDPDLVAAEQAFDRAEYREVLPSLARALGRPLPEAEKLRAYELMALIHAAFDEEPPAIEAFRRALGVNEAYAPAATTSPKVRALYEQARQLGPLAPPVLPSLAAAPPPPPDPPLTSRWWFWTGVGVVVSAGAIGAVYAAGSRVPPGNLGTGALR